MVDYYTCCIVKVTHLTLVCSKPSVFNGHFYKWPKWEAFLSISFYNIMVVWEFCTCICNLAMFTSNSLYSNSSSPSIHLYSLPPSCVYFFLTSSIQGYQYVHGLGAIFWSMVASQGAHPWKENQLSLSQELLIVNGSTPRDAASCSPPTSMLRFCLAWSFTAVGNLPHFWVPMYNCSIVYWKFCFDVFMHSSGSYTFLPIFFGAPSHLLRVQ